MCCWRSLSQSLSDFKICFTTIAVLLGTGILGLPVKLADSGFWPFLLVLTFVYLMQLASALLMTDVLQRASRRLNMFDVHSIGEAYLGRLGGILLDASTLLNLMSALISYSLAGSLAFGQATGAPISSVTVPYVLACVSLVVIFGSSLQPTISLFTGAKVIVLIFVVGAVGLVAGRVGLNPSSDWANFMDPFLVGTVAIGGIATLMPVMYPPPSQRTDARVLAHYRGSIFAGITICYILNLIWARFVLGIVPQTEAEAAAMGSDVSLEAAAAAGQIATIPVSRIITERYPEFAWVQATVTGFITLSITVSFNALGLGMKNMLDGLSLSFVRTMAIEGSSAQQQQQQQRGKGGGNQSPAWRRLWCLFCNCFAWTVRGGGVLSSAAPLLPESAMEELTREIADADILENDGGLITGGKGAAIEDDDGAYGASDSYADGGEEEDEGGGEEAKMLRSTAATAAVVGAGKGKGAGGMYVDGNDAPGAKSHSPLLVSSSASGDSKGFTDATMMLPSSSSSSSSAPSSTSGSSASTQQRLTNRKRRATPASPTMGQALQNPMQGCCGCLAKAFRPFRARCASSCRFLSLASVNPAARLFAATQALLYMTAFGAILGIALSNPQGFVLVIEIFTSMALNMSTGVFVSILSDEAWSRDEDPTSPYHSNAVSATQPSLEGGGGGGSTSSFSSLSSNSTNATAVTATAAESSLPRPYGLSNASDASEPSFPVDAESRRSYQTVELDGSGGSRRASILSSDAFGDAGFGGGGGGMLKPYPKLPPIPLPLSDGLRKSVSAFALASFSAAVVFDAFHSLNFLVPVDTAMFWALALAFIFWRYAFFASFHATLKSCLHRATSTTGGARGGGLGASPDVFYKDTPQSTGNSGAAAVAAVSENAPFAHGQQGGSSQSLPLAPPAVMASILCISIPHWLYTALLEDSVQCAIASFFACFASGLATLFEERDTTLLGIVSTMLVLNELIAPLSRAIAAASLPWWYFPILSTLRAALFVGGAVVSIQNDSIYATAAFSTAALTLVLLSANKWRAAAVSVLMDGRGAPGGAGSSLA